MSGTRLPWVIAGAAGLGLAAAVLATRGGAAVSLHPEPRGGITADKVLPLDAVRRLPGAAAAYQAAATAPATLDGVYCYCNCSRHSGHRSLLTCFETEHGAYCDVCMMEAELAARLAGEGQSLGRIRQAIDARFGS